MRRHAVPHDSVMERLPLSGVEPEDLDVAADSGQKRRQRPVLVRPLALASHLTTTTTTIVVVISHSHCHATFRRRSCLEY